MNRPKRTLALILASILVSAFVAASEDAPATSRPIGLQDILGWKSIGGASLSMDGEWLIYRLSPQEGESEVVIRRTKADMEYRFPIGQAPGFASPSAQAISADSRWAAFLTYPSLKETKTLQKERTGITSTLSLIDLATGEKTDFEKVKEFAFSGERAGFIALHRYPSEGREKEKDTWRGSDLILRDLARGTELSLGNVSEYAFDKKGTYLAYLVDARGMVGNGIQLLNLADGRMSALDGDKAAYSSLAWTQEGEALIALKGKDDKRYDDKVYSIVGYTGFLGTRGLRKTFYDPADDKTFPEGMAISPNRSPEWTGNLDAFLFGIFEPKKKKDATTDVPPQKKETDIPEEDTPGLVIWHWKERRLPSQQQLEEQQDRNSSFLSIFRVAEKKFIRLADESLANVSAAPKGQWVIGVDHSPYELDGNLDGRRFADIYVIDLRTGEKRLALEKNRWYYGPWLYEPSPDGTRFLFYDNGHFCIHEMATGRSFNITEGVPASFIDTESDYNVADPPIFPIGWAKSGVSVLLSDGWDVWNVPVRGGKAVNITVDGKRDGIRYHQRFVLDPREEGIDLAKPIYMGIYGEWTKKYGIAMIDVRKPGARKLLWDDAAFRVLMKAEKNETYLFTRETYKDYPDYYVAGADLGNGRRITDADPQRKDVLWSSGSRLVDYTSAKGDKLQAALFLPAGYEEGRAYPTIVYIYEKLSSSLNLYHIPSPYGFNKTVYTSHGYAVLMPDIVYKLNDPGMSAVWCVLPALEAAVATGIVDKANVGLQGGSWGGYQSAFLVTQTDAFAAVAASAPLTNMISMYSSMNWATGRSNQPLAETFARFTGGYWENIEAYTRNSPVYHAERVKTPMLILHNDKDGAVDWNQGIEYFNTLRRLKKPVVMLQYVGEGHGLAKPPNRKDYGVRMMEFFDHFLKGKPAPKWWEEGVSHLDLKDHLKERAKDLQLVEKAKKKETSAPIS